MNSYDNYLYFTFDIPSPPIREGVSNTEGIDMQQEKTKNQQTLGNAPNATCTPWERHWAAAMPPQMVERAVENGRVRYKCVHDLLPTDSYLHEQFASGEIE